MGENFWLGMPRAKVAEEATRGAQGGSTTGRPRGRGEKGRRRTDRDVLSRGGDDETKVTYSVDN